MDGGERVDLIGVVLLLLLLSPSSRGSVSNADDGTSTSSVNATPPTPATSPTLTFTEAPMVASSIALGSNNSGDENQAQDVVQEVLIVLFDQAKAKKLTLLLFH